MTKKQAQELVEAGLAEFGRGRWVEAGKMFSEAKGLDPANRQARDYLKYLEDQEKSDRDELGDLKRVPAVAISTNEILQLNVSPQTGYILSLVDGFISFEEIIATSGLGQRETRRELARLKRMDVIKVV